MHIACCVKLPLVKYIVNVLGYNRPVPLEQAAHLTLRQPNSLIGKEDIYLDDAVLGLVYYNFVVHALRTSASGSVRNKVTLCEPTSEAELKVFRESVTNHIVQR